MYLYAAVDWTTERPPLNDKRFNTSYKLADNQACDDDDEDYRYRIRQSCPRTETGVYVVLIRVDPAYLPIVREPPQTITDSVRTHVRSILSQLVFLNRAAVKVQQNPENLFRSFNFAGPPFGIKAFIFNVKRWRLRLEDSKCVFNCSLAPRKVLICSCHI